jgi:hypothetical protein
MRFLVSSAVVEPYMQWLLPACALTSVAHCTVRSLYSVQCGSAALYSPNAAGATLKGALCQHPRTGSRPSCVHFPVHCLDLCSCVVL